MIHLRLNYIYKLCDFKKNGFEEEKDEYLVVNNSRVGSNGGLELNRLFQ